MTKLPHITRPHTVGIALGDAELIGTFEHDSPEWHEARASVIGSSEVASILGVGYKSAYTLWHEKAGLIIPEMPSVSTARKFEYGHFMEPFVASLWEREHGETLTTTGTWRNRERPWQGCNPDRLRINKPGVVELKTFPMVSDWWDGAPAGYIVQVKWQLDVFGFDHGFLAGFANMSGDYVEEEVMLDPFEAEAIRAVVKQFADSITDGNPPEIDGSDGTYRTIRRLNPSITPKEEAEIPPDIAEAYLTARDTYKAADADLTKWKGHLLAYMGTAQYALYDGRKIASRVAVRDGVPYLKEA